MCNLYQMTPKGSVEREIGQVVCAYVFGRKKATRRWLWFRLETD